jgi:hypothetical protein
VGGAVTLLPLYYFMTCTGKKSTFSQKLDTNLEKNILEYIRFLLKNKSTKTYRKGRLNPPSELDHRIGQNILGGEGKEVEVNYFLRKHDNITFIVGQREVVASLALPATAKDFEPELLTAPETNSTKISRSGVQGWLLKLRNGIFQVEVQHIGVCNIKSVQHKWTINLATGLFIYNVVTKG